MSAARALAAAEAAGLRLSLLPDGRMEVEGPLPLPPAVLDDLRRHRDAVAHPLATRTAVATAQAQAARPAPAQALHPPPPPLAAPAPDLWLASIAKAAAAALEAGATARWAPTAG